MTQVHEHSPPDLPTSGLAGPTAGPTAVHDAGAGRAGAARATMALPTLFTVVIFLNASLLFIVQPLFSKLALPLLGGAPAVWNTCMLVFQALLLGGYLYAHLASRWLRPRRQLALHAALLALSLLVLPIGIRAGWTPPADGAPVPWLVGLVLVGLGAPFFLLSTGAPLLQQWFARTDHADAADPYFLYAASNAGSLLALLAYPFLVEPMVGLEVQRLVWSAAYAATALLVVTCGVVSLRRAARPLSAASRGAAGAGAVGEPPHAYAAEPSAIGWRPRAWWVLLAFAPSSLLLGVTSYLSTDVAAVPLLWVVPLALYLLTFVLVFARRPPVPPELMLRLQPLVFLPLVVAMFVGRGGSVRLMAPWHLLLFFVTAMVCHGELARLRPPAARLTEFYLWLSVGGVLGGAFNVLLAPLLFDRVLEYPLVLVLACALRPWPAWRAGGWRQLLRDVAFPAALGAVALGVLRWPGPWHPLVSSYVVPVVGGVGALVCLAFVPRPLRYAFGVLALLWAGIAGGAAGRPPMMAARSFFGAYTVRTANNGYHELYHGSTLHGVQKAAAAGDSAGREPLSYYGLRGPLGDIVGAARLSGRPLRLGVVGLGTGTVACYARPGDTITYYEIDPLIVTIAHDRRLFTYLSRCAPDARMVLGDARLSLGGDSAATYDVLVLDAFSSDAIPVHLLTREALRVYMARLAPGGVLAVHVSNRYLNLRPAVAALVADAGLVAMLGEDRRPTAADRARMITASVWIAVARGEEVLEPLGMRSRWQPLELPPGERVWTDDYSNVLGAMVW